MTTEVNIQELVNQHVTVEAGVATVHQDGIDAALLAVDVDPAEYKRMQKSAAKAAVGIVDSIGDKSIDAMVADKNLHNVSSSFKLGHEEYNVGVARTGQVTIPGKKGEEPGRKEVIGMTTVRRKTTVGSSGIGEAKKRIAALGIQKLGK